METLPSSAPVLAEVLACGVRAPYLRAGAGRPVLVLLPPSYHVPEPGTMSARPQDAPVWPAIAERLASHLGGRCRLIVPAAPPPSESLADWLSAFADGLGVAGVGLVAADPLGEAALAFAVREAELVARLVLLRDAVRASPSGAVDIERVEREGIPLLVLSLAACDLEEEEGLDTILAFLDGLPRE